MRATGLYKFAGAVFASLLVLAGLAYAVGGGRDAAIASPSATPAAVDLPPPAEQRAAADAACAPDGGLREMDGEIHESSGVAVSRRHAGIFWTHNDSGDPLLYAVDAQGRTAGRVRVEGAEVEDWEDVAAAPCPDGGDCLWVADIGDNDAERASITVYRLPEPAPGDARSAPAQAIRLRYPDGPHDAEAMFVLNGAIHVVTKGETGAVTLYRAPASAAPGAETALERVRTLSAQKVGRKERITSADASADGRWVALRTLREVSLYPADGLLGSGAPSARVDVRPLGEAQGEGIGFTPDGSLVLTSEGGKRDTPATFARLSCSLPR